MYAWKVDVGMWPEEGVTNINELTITDTDVPFVILTSDFSQGGAYSSKDLGYSGVYDAAASIMGSSVDALYALARSYNQGQYDNAIEVLNYISSVFPSVFVGYPNLWGSIFGASQPITSTLGFYYFKKLKRLLVRGYATQQTAVYSVGENGSLTSLSDGNLNNTDGLGSISIGSGNRHIIFFYSLFDSTKELTYENLISNDNYRVFSITARTDKEVECGFGTSPMLQSNAPKMARLLFEGNPIEPDFSINEDPFESGGSSETGGGGGDFDNTSTPIEIPGLPGVSAASTGFISLFNPTLSQLNELASYMWSDVFDIDTLKKLFADPMDVILGLSILPVQIPTSGAKEVKVGNIGTGISLNVASTQFVEVDCGTINVNEYWGAYLDYSPYTHAQIYLPYVGVRPISVDEIMGKSVNVNYHVDILTGACCCFVKCGDSVLYSFNGQCSIPIPITATNYTNTINGIISVAASLGTMVATGGATAPLALTNLASTITNQMKPTVEKSGAISGPGGVMGIQTPYLILTRPRQALPSKQNTFTGYPSFITVTLGELSGYTEVHTIHLENIPATADELSEIETLLKGGVIF